MLKTTVVSLVAALLPASLLAQSATTRPPIIDVHLHASTLDEFGGGGPACVNEGRMILKGWDPTTPLTPDRLGECAATVPPPRAAAKGRINPALAFTDRQRTPAEYRRMHAAGAFAVFGEIIAMLHSHPQLYVDVAQNDWGFPRAHFDSQLERLVDAGFEERIMFGSDQMIWPATIEVAIRTIEQAPFLTEKQKRAIFQDNAARFLRLSEGEIATHHGR